MDRRILTITMALVLALLLAGCSVVFQAGISGKVVTASGTGTASVSDVSVFAYTDKAQRDSDFKLFCDEGRTRPTEGSGYVATTTTNANGEFTVNKVVWESKKSEFGKTADVSKLYLIFYHKDYKPATWDSTVISDSTNADNVYIELEPAKKYTTINIVIDNVSTGNAMTVPSTLRYWVGDSASFDTVTLTGGGTISISFPVEEESTTVRYWLESSGTRWAMVDKDGDPIEYETCFSEIVKEGSHSVVLYMKNYEFTMPGFSGNIDGTMTLYSDDSHDGYDDLPIWLEYWDVQSSQWVAFEETKLAQNKTYRTQSTAGDNVFYTHGLFSDVGSNGNFTITVNEDTYPHITDWDAFDGTNLVVKLRIAVKDATMKYCEFEYTVGRTPDNLRKIDLT